jgi:hypothetical protein
MARQTPGDLADEILPDGGPWFLDSALFRPSEPKTASYVSVSLFDAAAAACCSGIMLNRGELQKGRDTAGALKRSGYEMRGPVYATRPLRGLRELDAEVRRLEALAGGRATIASFPARALRRPPRLNDIGSFPAGAFNRLRHAHAWILESVCVGRGGPVTFVEAPTSSTKASCNFSDDGDERSLDLYVYIFRKWPRTDASEKDFVRSTRAARQRLTPLGYRAFKVLGPKYPLPGTEGPSYALFTKRVGTLAEARRERARLDRVIFGD